MFCNDPDYNGECLTYGPWDYPSLPLELNNRISSARRFRIGIPITRIRPGAGATVPTARARPICPQR